MTTVQNKDSHGEALPMHPHGRLGPMPHRPQTGFGFKRRPKYVGSAVLPYSIASDQADTSPLVLFLPSYLLFLFHPLLPFPHSSTCLSLILIRLLVFRLLPHPISLFFPPFRG